LYHSLPLAEYLPPGAPLEPMRRQAHLQRLAIMASKLLTQEVIVELHELTSLSDDSPLSEQERRIIRTAINRVPYYQDGCLDDHVAFFDEMRRLARRSPVLRRLRFELACSLPARWKMRRYWRHPYQIARTVSHGLRLFLPSLG